MEFRHSVFSFYRGVRLIRACGHRLYAGTAAVLFSLFFLQSAFAAEGDIRILQSDAGGLLVEFTPRYTVPTPVTVDGTTYQRYDLEGGIAADGRMAGAPELPVRSATIALAGTRGNSVEAVTTEFEELAGVLLAPLAGAVAQDGEPVQRYTVDAAAYGRNEFVPAELCALRRIAETQGRVLADLQIAPMQYDAARRLLRRYTRIVVRVTFGPAERTSGGAMPKGIVLNDGGARTASAPSRAKSATLASSLLASGAWFRFNVTEEGIYKLSGQALLDAGVPASVDPHTISIYEIGRAHV
jgi:hypothetical protein